MNINYVSEQSDPNYFAQAGDVSITQNGLTLKTAGLFSCCALIVLQGTTRILCHVNDEVDPDQLTKIIKGAINTEEQFGFYYAIGCMQNSQQDTQGIVESVRVNLDCKKHLIGQVNDGSDRVSTDLKISPFGFSSKPDSGFSRFDL